jgi:CRP-like cAMP-binding protein
MTPRPDPAFAEAPVLAGLAREHLATLAACASDAEFDPGEQIAREGGSADAFYVVRAGTVAIELHAPGRSLTIETIGPGEVLGWSWLFPPHRWHFDARALSPVAATRFDGACLRAACEADAALGYDLTKRFAQVFVDRLRWTRLRLLDVYGDDR